MTDQILGMLGLPGACNIVGRCSNEQRGVADVSGDQIVTADPADPDGEVETFLNEIGNTVRKHDIESDIRIGAAKSGERRCQPQGGQRDRGGQAQAPARVAGLSSDTGFGFFQVGQQLRAALEVGEAFIRGVHAPRRAIDQAHVELGFQLRHHARHGSGGKAGLISRRDETAGLDHRAENTHRFEFVH